MVSLGVERSIWINAPRERVWQAITDPAQIEAWFSPGLRWEIPRLEAGATATWHSSADEADLHIIEVVEAPRLFRLRWEPQPPATALVTTYQLDEESGGTRVTVREAGYELVAEELRDKRMASATSGYEEALKALKAHVEGG